MIASYIFHHQINYKKSIHFQTMSSNEDNDWENPDQDDDNPYGYAHPEFGRCPWGHSQESDCDCSTPRCREVTDDRLELFRAGDFRGPGRYIHGSPVPSRPTRSPPPLYRNVRGLPRIHLAELSRIAGGFRRADSEGSDELLETSENFPQHPNEYKELTLGLGSKPCTEQIPWKVPRDLWDKPCPNDRRGTKLTQKEIRICARPLQRCWQISNDLREGDQDPDAFRSYVCEDHRKDTRDFLQVDNLLLAHLVGTCRDCRVRLKRRYPNGINTCTCPKLFERWLCRSCVGFEVKCLQNHFRRRVVHEPPHDQYGDQGGRANRQMIKDNKYHLDWRGVRRMLAQRHPCTHLCGKKRVLSNTDAMDCRGCGGKIVTARRQTRRENKEPFVELDFSRGNGRSGKAQFVDSRSNDVRIQALEEGSTGSRSASSNSGFDNWVVTGGTFRSESSIRSWTGEMREESEYE